MILSALSFLAGLLCVQQFSDLPGSQWLFLIALSAVIMALLRYWRWLFFAVGLLWAVIFAMVRLSDRLPESFKVLTFLLRGLLLDYLSRMKDAHVLILWSSSQHKSYLTK